MVTRQEYLYPCLTFRAKGDLFVVRTLAATFAGRQTRLNAPTLHAELPSKLQKVPEALLVGQCFEPFNVLICFAGFGNHHVFLSDIGMYRTRATT